MKNQTTPKFLMLLVVLGIFVSCNQNSGKTDKALKIKIIQLDPTHGHAAAAQSEQLSGVDTIVYLYAPEKTAVNPYLQQINSCNSRKDNPTRWNEVTYFGSDYLDRMLKEKRGNVVVLAGNNRIKIDYIEQSINAGLNVFSDKPMVINQNGFERLKNAYEKAGQTGILLFDMMTERYSLINRIQKSLMQDTLLFGHLLPGTADHPSVMESSVHHFYRGGKGTRPAWYFDVLQQGEGIVDVTTHLIDLTFWKDFPEESIDYKTEVKILTAKRWPVTITKRDFSNATSLPEIPASLDSYRKDSVLEVFANGSITYSVKGIFNSVKVEWRAATPIDGNDLRNAYAEGSRCKLLITQEYGQDRPRLTVQKGENISFEDFKAQLNQTIARLQKEYPGISVSDEGKTVQIMIPSGLGNSYDPTFKVFVSYLINKNMPMWEVPNTLAKYYITTTALEMAKKKK